MEASHRQAGDTVPTPTASHFHSRVSHTGMDGLDGGGGGGWSNGFCAFDQFLPIPTTDPCTRYPSTFTDDEERMGDWRETGEWDFRNLI